MALMSVYYASVNRSQVQTARNSSQPFNLIISPRTETVSGPVKDAIFSSGGVIVEFNVATGSFKSVTLEGNRIIR